MSVEAMAWAFKQDIDDAQTKLVLLALCDHADEDGWCWPSLERLARKSACSHDTATRRIHMLENLGFIARRRRARQTTIYRILLNKKAMNTHHVRNHDIGPSEDQKAEMMITQNASMNTQNTPDDYAAIASLTINNKPSIETTKTLGPGLFGEEVRPKKRRAMEESWEPDAKGILFARGLGFNDSKIRQLAVACRDYHLKHGTLIAGSIGLAATWRTWCNNEVKFSEERRARYGAKSTGESRTRDDVILAGIRKTAAAMDGQRDDRRQDEEIFERRGSSVHASAKDSTSSASLVHQTRP